MCCRVKLYTRNLPLAVKTGNPVETVRIGHANVERGVHKKASKVVLNGASSLHLEMSEPDDLFTLRNHFWLGSYQLAIAEGSGLGRLSENLRIERDEFIYRSYIALGQHTIVLGEVRGGAEN